MSDHRYGHCRSYDCVFVHGIHPDGSRKSAQEPRMDVLRPPVWGMRNWSRLWHCGPPLVSLGSLRRHRCRLCNCCPRLRRCHRQCRKIRPQRRILRSHIPAHGQTPRLASGGGSPRQNQQTCWNYSIIKVFVQISPFLFNRFGLKTQQRTSLNLFGDWSLDTVFQGLDSGLLQYFLSSSSPRRVSSSACFWYSSSVNRRRGCGFWWTRRIFLHKRPRCNGTTATAYFRIALSKQTFSLVTRDTSMSTCQLTSTQQLPDRPGTPGS